MTDAEKIAFVEKIWRAYRRLDFAEAFPHMADDVRLTIFSKGRAPPRETRGKEKLAELAKLGASLFAAPIAIETRHAHCAGSTVILEWTIHGETRRGTRYDNDYCMLFELEDAKIVRAREYFDTMTAAEAFRG